MICAFLSACALQYGTHVAGKTLEAGNFSAHVMGDASTFIASATIGKENTEYINRLALNATGLAFDATGMATGLALGAGAVSSQNYSTPTLSTKYVSMPGISIPASKHFCL